MDTARNGPGAEPPDAAPERLARLSRLAMIQLRWPWRSHAALAAFHATTLATRSMLVVAADLTRARELLSASARGLARGREVLASRAAARAQGLEETGAKVAKSAPGLGTTMVATLPLRRDARRAHGERALG